MDVEFDAVSFSYGRRQALVDVNWRIGEPGVVGLLGPNGAGKTTLLSLLVTLANPGSGTVRIAGHDLATKSGRDQARKLLGFVPQRFSLAPEMRLRDTVAYAAWVNGLADSDSFAAAEHALSQVGLAEKASARVRSLSGGQRQRLGIAASLAHDPSLLVLDEPTVGLDPGQRLRVRELIASLGQERTVVLSSHLLEDISHLCQRVALLANGRLAFDGTVDQFSSLLRDADTGPAGEAALGSSFERAYDHLIARLEGAE